MMTIYDSLITYGEKSISYDGSGMAFGIDQSSRPPPSASSLVAAGVKFCNHYIADRWTSPVILTDPSTWATKCLRPSEIKAYINAGIQVFTNWETSADAMLGGWSRGVEAAKNSLTMAGLCGLPANRPIYFSADSVVFNTFDNYKLARSFLQGAASVLGVNRVGVYGSYYVVDWARTDEVAKWFWQTWAWSDKFWHPAAHIRQFPDAANDRFHVIIGGVQCDIDRSMVADYGQWPIGGEMLDDADKAYLFDQFNRIIRYLDHGGTDAGSNSHHRQIRTDIANLSASLAPTVDDEAKILAATATARDAVLAAITAIPTSHFDDNQLQQLAGVIVAEIQMLGITAPTTDELLDALKARLET